LIDSFSMFKFSRLSDLLALLVGSGTAGLSLYINPGVLHIPAGSLRSSFDLPPRLSSAGEERGSGVRAVVVATRSSWPSTTSHCAMLAFPAAWLIEYCGIALCHVCRHLQLYGC
jgi:hypothetical protein